MRETKTIGRPREFDADSMLLKIMDVFWARGFVGTTLSHLVAATGLKKGSLYAAFGDKREMYLKALALYDRTAIAATRAQRDLLAKADTGRVARTRSAESMSQRSVRR